jgi:hypothetical protein
MATFHYGQPDYFRAATSPSEVWRRELALAAGTELASIHVGVPDDEHAPVAALMQLPADYVLPKHAHDCYRVEVLISGQLSGPHGEAVSPGDIRTSAPGEFYGPYTAGPDGAVSVEIFSAANRRTIWAPDLDPESAQTAALLTAAAAEQGQDYSTIANPA